MKSLTNKERNMDGNINETGNGSEYTQGGTSTFKRVIALVAVALLLAVGVFVIPIMLGSHQADINDETRASNSYSAAAQLGIRVPVRSLSEQEAGSLDPNGELMKDVEVSFSVPKCDDGSALIFVEGKDVRVTSARDICRCDISENDGGVFAALSFSGAEEGEYYINCGEKRYSLLLKDGGSDSYDAEVSAIADK